MKVILPPDVWWPLRVTVERGGTTPMTTWFYWTWQFFRTREIV